MGSSYFRNRAVELYWIMTYREWMLYFDCKNLNVITKAKDYFINKFFPGEEDEFRDFIDSVQNVALPLIAESITEWPLIIDTAVSFAESLIDIYYTSLSKRMKYFARVLSTVTKKHKSDNYYICIPIQVSYEKEVMGGSPYKSVKTWQRQNLVRWY